MDFCNCSEIMAFVVFLFYYLLAAFPELKEILPCLDRGMVSERLIYTGLSPGQIISKLVFVASALSSKRKDWLAWNRNNVL